MFNKIHIIPLLSVFLVLQSCAREQKVDAVKPKEPKHELYLSWHNECLGGDKKNIDAHIAKFEAQIAADADDHLARAYLGSANALRAKASFWGPTKLKYLNRGKNHMDGAVAAAPDDPRVRMVRAIGLYKIPKRFGKRPTAIDDFKKIVPAAHKGTHHLSVPERQAILYYAWQIYKEEGVNGAEALRKSCHQLAPASKYGKLSSA